MTVGGKLEPEKDPLRIALDGLESAQTQLNKYVDDEVKDLLLEVEDVGDRLSLLIRSKKIRAAKPAGGGG